MNARRTKILEKSLEYEILIAYTTWTDPGIVVFQTRAHNDPPAVWKKIIAGVMDN